jgi:Leucine-rich repeat (LRR) protein
VFLEDKFSALTGLQELDLSDNAYGRVGSLLALQLPQLTELTMLNLSGNDVDEGQLEVLLPALRQLKGLRLVRLARNALPATVQGRAPWGLECSVAVYPAASLML